MLFRSTITDASLRAAGLVRRSQDGVRLLAKGEVKAKLNLEVAGASASAIDAIKRAGGSVKTTFVKKVYMNKKGEPGKKSQRRQASAEKRASRNAG
mgnify:FL=1